MRRWLAAVLGAGFVVMLQATPALACGALVAPNGSVRLDRATTFVAWHGGVEHYLTSFAYEGQDLSDFGYIIPLPAIPTSIQEGGAWTLQRLEREFAPPVPEFATALQASAANSATVIETVQVEALNITVLKGSGDEIIKWCQDNHFVLPQETADHLKIYAQGSPIFLAAKYDVARAQLRQQIAGDGTPVLITMPTAHIWVPLEVLASDDNPVSADLFLLTDEKLVTGNEDFLTPSPIGLQLAGAPGFTVAAQEPMNPPLFHDLSTDRNMGWVPSFGYITYLTLRADGASVNYDLGVSDGGIIKLASFGTNPQTVATAEPSAPYQPAAISLAILLAIFMAVAAVAGTFMVVLSARRAEI